MSKSNQSDIQSSRVGPIYDLIHGETFELVRRIYKKNAHLELL